MYETLRQGSIIKWSEFANIVFGQGFLEKLAVMLGSFVHPIQV